MRPTSGFVLLMLLAIVPPVAQAADDGRPFIATEMTAALAQIDRSDGVDASEAKALASAYFLCAISGCGGVGEVRVQDGVWIADSLIGRGAQDGPSVSVARDGSFVRAAGYPSVTISGGAVTVHDAEVEKP